MIKIALIDDNKTVLMVNEVMLKKERIVTENDLISKYTEISNFSDFDYIDFANKFDFVVCDYNLGKDSINGLEFLKKVLSINNKLVCILLTGEDSFFTKTKVALQGNIHYVVKNNNNNKENGAIFQIGKIINDNKLKS